MVSNNGHQYALRSDVDSLREDMREDITGLRSEIAMLRTESAGGLRWSITTAIALIGTALMTFIQLVR